MPNSQKVHAVKPIECFPTKARADGRFQKRILGHLYYFGREGDRATALVEYDRAKHDLYAGRKPRIVSNPDALNLKQLANLFTDEQVARHAAGEITEGHLSDYRSALRRMLKHFGSARLVSDLRPEDFAQFSRHLGSKLGHYAFNRERACVVAMFNHAADCRWITHPVLYRKHFKKKSVSELRAIKRRRLFSPADLRKMIDGATGEMKAMILLGINGGFGATDCTILPRAHVDLKARRIETIRRKRNIVRHVPLWRETADAIAAVVDAKRATVFSVADDTAIIKRFIELIDALNIERSEGIAFGALRHTFATIANRRQDPDATKRIMGRKLDATGETYVDEIDWRRLKRVTDHVRSRVFSSRGNGPSR